jgi:hypothetical protein
MLIGFAKHIHWYHQSVNKWLWLIPITSQQSQLSSSGIAPGLSLHSVCKKLSFYSLPSFIASSSTYNSHGHRLAHSKGIAKS